jgi:hypothetical protein
MKKVWQTIRACQISLLFSFAVSSASAQDVYNFVFQKQASEAEQVVPSPTPEPLAPSYGREIFDEESALESRHLRPWEVTLGIAQGQEAQEERFGKTAPATVFGFRYYFNRYLNAQLDITSPAQDSGREAYATLSAALTPITVTVFGSDRLRFGVRYGLSQMQREIAAPVAVGSSARSVPPQSGARPMPPTQAIRRFEDIRVASWGVVVGFDFNERWTAEYVSLFQEGSGFYERSSLLSVGYRL